MTANDSNKVTTIEEERVVFENHLRELGVILHHNYFRAERGYRPFIHTLLSFMWTFRAYISKSYFLAFTDKQLILMHRDRPQGSINDNVLFIDYKDIQNFSLKERFRDYCIQFEYNGESFYFYLDGGKVFSSLYYNYSSENFQFLKERNFMGLM